MLHISGKDMLTIVCIMAACYAAYLGIVLGVMAVMGWC